MVERYRDLERPSLIDASSGQFNSGDADVHQRLAESFKSFSNIAGDFSNKMFAKAGARAGTDEGAAGDLKSGLLALTTYGKAYNNAATREYTIKAQADADETAARIEESSNLDPEVYKTQMTAVREAAVKQAHPELRGVINDIYEQHIGAGTSRLIHAQAEEIRKNDRNNVAEGIARSTDRIAQLNTQDDPVSAQQAEEEQVKLNLLIDGAVNSGTLTKVEAGAMHISSQRQIVAQSVSARFDKELTSPYGNPVAFIERFKEANKKSEALSPAEEAKLEDKLMANLREHNSLMEAKRAQDTAQTKARQLAGDRIATTKLLSGQLSQRDLLTMVQDSDLSPEVGRTLLNELQSGQLVNHSDPKTLFSAKTTLLEHTELEIATMPGLTWGDRAQLIEDRRKQELGWRGTQRAREATERIDRALRILPGTDRNMLSDDEKRQREAALNSWYDEVDALPTAERDKAVIPASERIIEKVIRNNASTELEQMRTALEKYKKEMGDPAKMNDKKRENYEEVVKRNMEIIRNLEVRAK